MFVPIMKNTLLNFESAKDKLSHRENNLHFQELIPNFFAASAPVCFNKVDSLVKYHT